MKLQRYNDWGSIYYAPQGKGLSAIGTANVRFGIDLKDGMRVTVTWPNGIKEKDVALRAKSYTERISDMGHSYNVTSNEFGFYVNHHGVKLWVPIEEVDIKL
jgi:hypothetical protein